MEETRLKAAHDEEEDTARDEQQRVDDGDS